MSNSSFWPVALGVLLSGLVWVVFARSAPWGTIILLPLVCAFYAGRWSATQPESSTQ